MGFLDVMGELFGPGYTALANFLRGGVPHETWELLKPRGARQTLTVESPCQERPASVNGREATYCLPAGWSEQDPSEVTEIEAVERTGTHLALRCDLPASGAHSIRMFSAEALPPTETASGCAIQMAWRESQRPGLELRGPISRIAFGGTTGYKWSLAGNRSGLRVVHIVLWVPDDEGAGLKFMTTAPADDAHAAERGFDTVIASWRWRNQPSRPTGELDVPGGTLRVRNPKSVVLLEVLTGGIYGIYWWYQINREMRDLGRTCDNDELGNTDPWLSLLAITIGALAVVPPWVSLYKTVRRVKAVQAIASDEQELSGWTIVGISLLALIGLWILVFPITCYLMQRGLNRAYRYSALD